MTLTLPTVTVSTTEATPFYTYALLRSRVRCTGPKQNLGWAASLGDCASACARISSSCRFFIYGFSSVTYHGALHKCYWEQTVGSSSDPCDDASSTAGLSRDAEVLGYATDAYNLYELVREETSCGGGEGSWGQLDVHHRELSSHFDVHACGPVDNCFDGLKTLVIGGTECSQLCMTSNETNPYLLMQFRQPVQLTSLFVYPSPDNTEYLEDGYIIYTAQRVYGVDGWSLCVNRTDMTTSGTYYHDTCVRSYVRSVKIELPGAHRSLALLEVLAYGCPLNFTDELPWRGRTPENTGRVDRTAHGFYCGTNPDREACQVPVGTMCLGGLVRDWEDTLATPTFSFCGDKGTCLALADSPVPTSTCVCNEGYELRFIGKHHVTCTSTSRYPGYRAVSYNATLMRAVILD